jgi:hypothetical protein
MELLERSWGGSTGWALMGWGQWAGACPPQLVGLVLAIVGMLVGSWARPNRPAGAAVVLPG